MVIVKLLVDIAAMECTGLQARHSRQLLASEGWYDADGVW